MVRYDFERRRPHAKEGLHIRHVNGLEVEGDLQELRDIVGDALDRQRATTEQDTNVQDLPEAIRVQSVELAWVGCRWKKRRSLRI